MGSIPPTGPNPPDWQSPFQPQDNLGQYKQQLSGYIGEANQLAQEYDSGKIDAATLKSKLQDLIKQNNNLQQQIDSSSDGGGGSEQLSEALSVSVSFLNQALDTLNSGGSSGLVAGEIHLYAETAQNALQ